MEEGWCVVCVGGGRDGGFRENFVGEGIEVFDEGVGVGGVYCWK